MPVKTCQSGGKNGFKWGDEGKCYTYSNDSDKEAAREKAKRQGRAIEVEKTLENPDHVPDPEISTEDW